ncbi:MAG: prepilin peptidase [Lentisphaeria bacterium]|nr:prepilin peptidase [Lentisphaeria bacterium]
MNWEMWYHWAGTDWFARSGMIYPGVWSFIGFWVFALGACFGSFLNVCVWRIPRGESLSQAASHCTRCGIPIRWFDNLPVLSFLILRGRCRHCGERYSSAYFWGELSCGCLFVLSMVKTGLMRQYPGLILFQSALIFFALGGARIDWRHRIIPDKMTVPAMVTALLLSLAFPRAWGVGSHLAALGICVSSGAIPAAVLWLFARAGKFVCRKEIVGMGDIKFLLGLGMLAGLPGGLFALFFGAVAGCAAGLFTGRKWHDSIAFGPFLAAGAIVWIFADTLLLNAYRNFCLTL